MAISQFTKLALGFQTKKPMPFKTNVQISPFTQAFANSLTFSQPQQTKEKSYLETIMAREEELRKAPEKPQTIIDKIISKIPTSIKDSLFGRKKEFLSLTGRLPETIQEELATSGLIGDSFILPFITRSQSVKSKKLEERLIKDGATPERAFIVSQAITGADLLKKQTVKEKLKLTSNEKKSIRIRELLGGTGALTDVAMFPIGKIFKITKPLVELLKIAKTTDKATEILRGAGVSDDLIKIYAPKFAKLTNEAEIKTGLKSLEDAITTTKISTQATKGVKDVGIPKELEPLAVEARKKGVRVDFIERFNTKAQAITETDGSAIRIYVLDKNGGRLPMSEIKRRLAHEISHIEDISSGFKGLKMSKDELANILNYRYGGKIGGGADINIKIPYNKNEAFAYANELLKTNPIKLKELAPDFYTQATKGIKEVAEEIPSVAKVAKVAEKERGFITSVKEAYPEVKVSGRYIPRETDELAIKARNQVKDDIFTAEKIALQGTDDKAVATASELIKFYGEAGRYDDAARIANEVAGKLTEQGRAIQAASILGKMTPEGQVRFAAREIQKYNETIEKTRGGLLGLKKKVPELTEKQAKEIMDEMKIITKMEDGIKKAIAFYKLQNKISDLVPSPLYKKLINLWKAGLLTGIKTSGLNTFSNLFHGVSEIAKDIPATVVDSVASLFTGKRTLAFTLRGTGAGVKEGFFKGVRYMKTGFDERNIAIKLDWRRVNFGTSKIAKGLQKYEQTVFRLMGAEDQPFYYGAKARSLVSQAIAQGKNQKLKGKALEEFVNKLIQSPTDEMLKYAQNDAEIAVFQNRTLLGDVARGIQKIPGGEVVVPFGRTPSAVANQLINYSPIGIIKAIVLNIGKGKFDQRIFSQAVGRGIIGTGVMYIGTELFKNKLLSLSYPKTDRERRQWELEGRKENSIKMGGKWRSASILGPAGFVLTTGGYYQQAIEESGSHFEALAQASLGGLTSLKDQTFLRGINQFTEALDNPESFALSYFANLVASGIPTIVSDIGRVSDPFERRTGASREGFLAPLKGRVVGARQTLEEKRDVLGRPIERAGNAIETFIDPSRPTRIKSSMIVEELKRLAEAGFYATPTTFANEKSYTKVLTPEQISYLQEKAGSILEVKLEKLFELPEYKKLSDDEKKKKIQDFTEKARLISRAEMVEILVQGLSGEELKVKLSELKETQFLTRSVFQKWQELFR